MSQISRSPSLPLFVQNETVDPSGEIDQAMAWLRSLVGIPPRAETVHMFVLAELHSFQASTDGWTLTRNRVLSGNHGPTSHFMPLWFSSSGSGTTSVSSVAMSFK